MRLLVSRDLVGMEEAVVARHRLVNSGVRELLVLGAVRQGLDLRDETMSLQHGVFHMTDFVEMLSQPPSQRIYSKQG